MEPTLDHSIELGALAKALAGAQSKLHDAKKDATNPHFKNRYATLASVRAAVTPALSEAGIALLQTFEPHGDSGVCIVTTMIHESGQWLRSRLFLPVGKKDAQGFGSAISYGRRYSLAAIVGIAADDDDDGEAAVGKRPAAAPAVSSTEATGAEAAFAKMLGEASTADALGKVHAEVAKAVQAGILDDKARARLREHASAAIKRLATPNGAHA